jgi:hypothetical protein
VGRTYSSKWHIGGMMQRGHRCPSTSRPAGDEAQLSVLAGGLDEARQLFADLKDRQ